MATRFWVLAVLIVGLAGFVAGALITERKEVVEAPARPSPPKLSATEHFDLQQKCAAGAEAIWDK